MSWLTRSPDFFRPETRFEENFESPTRFFSTRGNTVAEYPHYSNLGNGIIEKVLEII